MKENFKVKTNYAVAIFVPAYILYIFLMLFKDHADIRAILSVGITGLILLIWLIGWRPYIYTVEKKELYIKRRFFKNKVYNIVDFETITDPENGMKEFFRRSGSMEIYYDNGNEKITVYPDDRSAFTAAILRANKRITCNVRAYNDTHKISKKKRRRDKRKAEKLEMQDEI